MGTDNRNNRIDPGRRKLLKSLATGAVVASTGADLSGLLPGSAERPAVRERTILELAGLLRSTPREKVFDVAVERIAAGATERELLGGTLLAGVQDVSPRPPGTKFHVVLMAPSAMELSRADNIDDRWLPIFFNIDVLKSSQERDIREGAWEQPPPGGQSSCEFACGP